ncbi:DUF3048 domain-containing protein [Fusibacter ferrireducens]|uniref:DUF3048 domain-containing protein n=1 Tax=Fusibacter ferrireducens TaxID=2785058 RepID=A0ABR9ZWU1_9FIRM|nr:DUF3048 domain-containing protein [Fusibacter ferrireducens]MBF4694922.1 DUF3048 domain-containing protein [Fusibacter ferrireducens]
MNRSANLKISLLLILILALVMGCQKQEANVPDPEDMAKEAVTIVVPEQAAEVPDEEKEPVAEPINLEGKAINKLTGLYIDEEQIHNRPIVVMLDNQFSARPQAAIEQADIMYEFLAEGRITRYMAVFYSQRPEHIGPVRSARPYFLLKALEYDPYYVHVGGSMDALAKIKSYKMADIDGLSSGAFWRENHKKIPHNMYTSSEVLLKDASRKKYRETPEFNFLDFYDQFTAIEGTDATEIKFVYKEPTKTDKVGYTTSYKYNNEEQLYYRYTNNGPHVDENSKVQITCTNIIAQYAKTKVLDSEGRLQVDLVGSGTGEFFTSGKVVPIKWEKADKNALTKFYTLEDQPIKLNPGVTWFQIMETGTKAIVKKDNE